MNAPGTAARGDHVADRLPAYLNDTLPPEERVAVAAHLAICFDCRTSLAAWSAIATATGRAAERTERIVARGAIVPFKRPIAPEPAAAVLPPAATIEEQPMHAVSTTMNPPIIVPPARRLDWQGVLRPLSQVAAVLLIGAMLLAGLDAVMRGGPSGGGAGGGSSLPGVIPSDQGEGDCTAQPPSGERLATVLELNGILTGTTADVSDWIAPSVTIDEPATLPVGQPVVEPTQDDLAALWAQFVACGLRNDGSEYGLVTDDGLRRSFYQTVYTVSSAAVASTTDYSKVLAGRDEVNLSSTPESKESMAVDAEPPVVTAKTGEVSGLQLGEMVTLPDGRIVAALEDPARTEPAEFEGLVVFVADRDGWLIDDFYAFHG